MRYGFNSLHHLKDENILIGLPTLYRTCTTSSLQVLVKYYKQYVETQMGQDWREYKSRQGGRAGYTILNERYIFRHISEVSKLFLAQLHLVLKGCAQFSRLRTK